MSNLDDPAVYQRLDPSGMIERIGDLPQQCRMAWSGAVDLPLPPDFSNVDKVVILGMGGSAIGGDIVSSLALKSGKAAVIVQRDYYLPRWVDERTLVIASSYSGNTEETISAFSEALQSPAKKLVITTGGRLQELAAENGIPTFIFHYRAEPRAALGYSFLSILAFLHSTGLIEVDHGDVDEAIGVLEEASGNLGRDVPHDSNPAKQLATRLQGRLAVIYGADFLSRVADRWKAQINECSKGWAFAECFPELNHNAVVGYSFPDWFNQKVVVVMLRSPLMNPRILTRYNVTGELLDKAGIDSEVVEPEGNSELARLMSAVSLGDHVSYYLAILNGVDPSPVQPIDYLKKRLSES
jgi:glucose/mannose-6-phosphate isomerase